MKKTVSLFAFLLIAAIGYSQTSTTGATAKAVKTILGPRNAIKTNVAAYYPLTTANIYYEFKVSDKVSVGTGFGYKIPQSFTIDAVADLADDDDDFTWTGDIEPQGLYVNPYVRFYPKGAISGFYLEAFLRYYKYTMTVPYEWTRDNPDPMPDQIIKEDGDGEADGYGGGIMAGYQWALGPTMVIDIYGGMGLASGSFHAETPDDSQLTPDEFKDIADEIQANADAETEVNIPFMQSIVNEVKASSSPDKAWVDIENVPFPILRFGILIGGAF